MLHVQNLHGYCSMSSSEDTIPVVIHASRATKVVLSPHRKEIEKRILAGESLRSISRWLKDNNEDIGEHALRGHAQQMAPIRSMINQSLYARFHLNLGERVDALKELYNLVVVQMRRLSTGLKQELDKKTLSGVVGKEVQSLRESLVSIIKLEMELGIREMKATAADDQIFSDDQLKELLERVANTESNNELDGNALNDEPTS